MKTTIKRQVLAAAILFAAGCGAAQAELAVIVSSKSPVANLTVEQAGNIFLGKASSFPAGGTAVPIDQAEGATRDQFYTKVTSKSSSQVKAYWSKLIFTGKGQPPKEVASSAEVKKLIAANPSMIGYIEKDQVDGSVKAVLAVP